VIVTENVGAGVRDGRDGFIVPVRDPQAIAEKLLILYKDEARRKEMGASGANYVRAFTWESYYRQMIGHYDRLLV
jgi:glycosyltransferase involved in cell wall biosynthesis